MMLGQNGGAPMDAAQKEAQKAALTQEIMTILAPMLQAQAGQQGVPPPMGGGGPMNGFPPMGGGGPINGFPPMGGGGPMSGLGRPAANDAGARRSLNGNLDALKLLSEMGDAREKTRTDFVAHPFFNAPDRDRNGNAKKPGDAKNGDEPIPEHIKQFMSMLNTHGPGSMPKEGPPGGTPQFPMPGFPGLPGFPGAQPQGPKPIVPDHITVVRKPLKYEGSVQKLREIKRELKLKDPWIDPDFEPVYNQHVKRWCRPKDISAVDYKPVKPGSSWYLFRGEPSVEDVRQGILGDCWLLSALGCLAEFNDARFVHALLPGQKNLSIEGVYLIRLCLGGSWREVLVDDRLPCVGGDGEFATHAAYCATVKRQIWASLIEKAFAKVSGSYEALSGGETSEALTMLTGWPCWVHFMHRPDSDAEDIWRQLTSSKKAGFLTCCNTGDESPWLQSAGLESQHAYSLMSVHQIKDKAVPNGQLRLLKIRNPQGERLWNGPWSKESDRWTPPMRERLGYDPTDEDNEGVFFMAYDDFQKYFDHCTICKIHSTNWSEARIPLELAHDEPTCNAVEIQVSEAAECMISLAQMEKRIRYGPLVEGAVEALSCIGFIVVPADGPGITEPGAATAVAVSRMQHKATASAECKLKAGTSYLVIPMSLHRGKQRQATVVCLTSKKATTKLRPVDIGVVQGAWAAYARHRAPAEKQTDLRHFEEQGGSLLITQGKGSGIVALLENRGPGYLKANAAITSSGLRYTRNQASTMDWLQPGFGQIVQVAMPATEQTAVSWMTFPSLSVSQSLPEELSKTNALWHCPELASAPGVLANLHKPFRIIKEPPPPELPEGEKPPEDVLSSENICPGSVMGPLMQLPRGWVRI